MEILLSIMLMIVPFISIFAFAVSLVVLKSQRNLKSYVIELSNYVRRNEKDPVANLMEDFKVREM